MKKNKQSEIEALKLVIEMLQTKLAKLETTDVNRDGWKPFPVPPSGCPDGWYDNGSGMCILDS